ncbi:MAG TPA: hypothetical protein VFB66_02095 [Tepidisphaeraceae bacterium]|nr:hypothetical protein [Tepidisphaeraceae bacterium]
MTRSTIPFVLGASAGAVVAAVANLLPYWQSHGAHGTDGYEVIGFPFTFRRMGGFAGIYEFRTTLLIADLLIAFAFAALVGWATVAVSLGSWRSGRGFPVETQRRGRTAAE